MAVIEGLPIDHGRREGNLGRKYRLRRWDTSEQGRNRGREREREKVCVWGEIDR